MNRLYLIGCLCLAACTYAQVEKPTLHESSIEEVAENKATAEPFALLELYTSEGCSSCPSAEAVVNEIAKKSWADREYIYALSFHVDYWNKLGWKDEFSNKAYSDRQRAYRSSFGNEVVYTPQMIVNGTLEVVANDRQKVNEAINKAMTQNPKVYFTITPDESWNNMEYSIISDNLEQPSNYSFNVAIVERGLVTRVSRGENSGKTLEHENIVRHFSTTAFNPNGEVLPIEYNAEFDKDFSIVCFVQNNESKLVVGANVWNY